MTTKCAVRNKFFHYKRPSKCWQTYLLNLQTFCFLNRSDQCNTLSRLSHTNNIYLLYILPNSCNINSWSPAKPLTDCKPHIIKKKACLGERKSIQPVKPARIVETEHFGLGRSDPTLTWLTVGNQCSQTTIDCTRTTAHVHVLSIHSNKLTKNITATSTTFDVTVRKITSIKAICILLVLSLLYRLITCLQCFDAFGWAALRTSGL